MERPGPDAVLRILRTCFGHERGAFIDARHQKRGRRDRGNGAAAGRAVNVRSPVAFALALLAASMVAGCTAPEETPPELTTVYRTVGTWSGTGNKTIGDVMLASGRFRVTWRTTGEVAPGSGRFRLTALSSVSGRPLHEVADHRGEGGDTLEFGEEDRRIYDFTVESENITWSFTVDDVIAVPK
jgi:hypothetical protein